MISYHIFLLLLNIVHNYCLKSFQNGHIEQSSRNELFKYINQNPKFQWKAITNQHQFRRNIQSENQFVKSIPVVSHRNLDIKIPRVFDAREYWKNCSRIRRVNDESHCAANWVIATVDSISDRICIRSNGRIDVQLSARDAISCGYGIGCFAGSELDVLTYWMENGIVTGGSYEEKTGCQPFPFPKCSHYITSKYPKCGKETYGFPLCEKICQYGYRNSYENDKFYGEKFYNVEDNAEDIQKEILMNGPVVASISVNVDLLNYTSGVYFPSPKSSNFGWITIRIIGWGYENNTPYWLCVNSWNEQWGDKGLFKVLRGKQAGFIESYVRAAIPKII
uniref:Peptidase C1A papain C-terminal domain-containing protein n=1 Tax=Trichobilharzia regenti TaxID=157069 RepID=A0AA85JSQ0_TRIRE|nr:unnamed protein product [Trichobilharzia regenti]